MYSLYAYSYNGDYTFDLYYRRRTTTAMVLEPRKVTW